MAMNASDHWANRRQLDVIIGVKARLICRGQGVLAVRAPFRHALDNPVRIGGERPEHPGTALSLFCRAALGAAGFPPLRRWYRRVVRGLGWPAQLRLEFGDAPGQFLDLRRLGQPQGDQLIFG